MIRTRMSEDELRKIRPVTRIYIISNARTLYRTVQYRYRYPDTDVCTAFNNGWDCRVLTVQLNLVFIF